MRPRGNPVRFTVDVERDAELHQQAFGGALAALELPLLESSEGVEEQLGLGARLPGRVEEFVVESLRVVSLHPHQAPRVSLDVPPAAGT
jgi:hypothetical protein